MAFVARIDDRLLKEDKLDTDGTGAAASEDDDLLPEMSGVAEAEKIEEWLRTNFKQMQRPCT